MRFIYSYIKILFFFILLKSRILLRFHRKVFVFKCKVEESYTAWWNQNFYRRIDYIRHPEENFIIFFMGRFIRGFKRYRIRVWDRLIRPTVLYSTNQSMIDDSDYKRFWISLYRQNTWKMGQRSFELVDFSDWFFWIND